MLYICETMGQLQLLLQSLPAEQQRFHPEISVRGLEPNLIILYTVVLVPKLMVIVFIPVLKRFFDCFFSSQKIVNLNTREIRLQNFREIKYRRKFHSLIASMLPSPLPAQRDLSCDLCLRC